MKITVLGHRGMLGNAVSTYISSLTEHELITIEGHYPNSDYLNELEKQKTDVIINCIGAIPQKKPSAAEYKLLNEELPYFLDSIGPKVIHPSTDCEFSGELSLGSKYSKNHTRDATDIYGQSKARVSEWIVEKSKNTKIIRTSIIGHELSSSNSLLDWFLDQETTVRGYTDHYWNGITTLEWARQALNLIENWDQSDKLTQLATDTCVSKFELLTLISEVYRKEIEIERHSTGKNVNKCLISDVPTPPLKSQLTQLRDFYSK